MLFTLLYFTTIAFAAELTPIEVTATDAPAAEGASPFVTNTVPGATWEQRGARVETALAGVPGLSFAANGGPGQTRSLFLRGAKSEHTLVLWDGLPVNDPSSPSRAFDFGLLPTGEIERIEVLKGPQSVLYGSDAMGGVVQFFTRRGDNPPRLRIEGGSYGTFRGRASAHGIFAGFEQSRGFSSADEREGNTERDGYRSWNIGGARDFALGANANLRLVGFYQKAKVDTDRDGGPNGDSLGTFSRTGQLALRAEALHVNRHGLESSVAASFFDRNRDDNTLGRNDYHRGNLWKLEARVRRVVGAHTPLVGVEYAEESGRSSEVQERNRFRAGAIYAQEEWRPGRWQLLAGARFDHHSEQGRAFTYRFGSGYWLVPEALRLKGSVGTGFKAPSLYQTYSAFGTRNLQPERSLGGDLGFEWHHEEWQGELAFFANRYRELVDFNPNPAPGRYYNLGRANTRGLELSLERRFGLFLVRDSATFLRTRDEATKQKLLRRPAFTNTLEAGHVMGDFVGLNLLFRYVGKREDVHPVLYTRQAMPGFFTVGADFFHRISDDWKVVARGENLLNRHYQETSGYGVPGASGYLGAEAEF